VPFLALEPIPLAIFTEHPEIIDQPLRSIVTDPDALANAIGAMVDFSLARRSRRGYQLHRATPNGHPPPDTALPDSKPPERRWWR
jgi:hypothetical protein